MVLFVLFQVIIFNNINFWGYANPYIYILFILFLPENTNRYLLIIGAFVIGISIDLFENTGGVNAFASVFIAFIRNPLITLLDNGTHTENNEIKFEDFSFIQWGIYLILLIFLHHFIIDFLESLQWSRILPVLQRSLIGSGITLVIAIFYLALFPPKTSDF